MAMLNEVRAETFVTLAGCSGYKSHIDGHGGRSACDGLRHSEALNSKFKPK